MDFSRTQFAEVFKIQNQAHRMAGLRGALMVRFERGVMWDVLNRMDRWCVEVGVNEL